MATSRDVIWNDFNHYFLQELILDGRISANGQTYGFDYEGNAGVLNAGAGGSVSQKYFYHTRTITLNTFRCG